MREVGFEISGLFDESPRSPVATEGGAGGRNPCEGFNGVMCGESVDGNGWCGAGAGLPNETGDGRVKLPVAVVSFPE